MNLIRVGVVSLGCSKNRVDSEMMIGYLKEERYMLTNDPAEADVLIVNTCGFIDSAKQESIDTILEMAQYKSNQCSTLVMTGCLVQRYKAELMKELPEVDLFLGVAEYEKLPEILSERYQRKLVHQTRKYTPKWRVLTTPNHYAYLRIAEGCNNHCTFCAIPSIRGPYKSRPMQDILAEAKELVSRGVKELIVVAQDTSRYGIELYGEKRLVPLLRELAKTDVKWLRVLYLYPEVINEEILEVFKEEEKLVKYLDIPIQHVDDDILLKMRRRTSAEQLKQLIRTIRDCDERFVIRTSLIAGFPGETDAQFNTLCRFLQDNPIDRVGVFTYSQEDGTPAAQLDNQIDEVVKNQRVRTIMDVQRKISQNLLERRVGSSCSVLVEKYDPKAGYYYGRSYGEAPDVDGCIVIDSSEQLSIGEFIDVEIYRASKYDLFAKVNS